MKNLKTSETKTIKRSQIKLNPLNPKHHGEEKIKQQKDNLKRVGYLGGIVWNAESGNLVDGHRRIEALDAIYNYDGTPETDYEVKVEVVHFDEKTEKEQMTFMALANSKADLQLIADYFPDIDPKLAGIDPWDLKAIESFIPKPETADIASFDDIIDTGISDVNPYKKETPSSEDGFDEEDGEAGEEEPEEMSYEDKKAAVIEAKARQRQTAIERANETMAYITISFASAEEKRAFCELAEIEADAMFVEGSKVLNLIQ